VQVHELRKIETIAESGNWLLLVSLHHHQLLRVMNDGSVLVKRADLRYWVRRPRLDAFMDALSAFWWDGAEEGLLEFRIDDEDELTP
jgi:hypothetical protein